MATSLEDGNLVWQKVKVALTNANPAAQGAFGELKKYLAQQKGNPNLQFFGFSEVECDDDDGSGLLSGACKIVGVYVKKEASATDNYFKIFDSATLDTTTTEQRIAIPLFLASQTAFEIYPDGFPMATGITVTQHTTSEGTTDGANGGDGFIIIAAP